MPRPASSSSSRLLLPRVFFFPACFTTSIVSLSNSSTSNPNDMSRMRRVLERKKRLKKEVENEMVMDMEANNLYNQGSCHLKPSPI
ncbi:hypothetical protein LXL04_018561 [Taraxacum kok-saghyz]